jgi:hypothetical protein
MRFLKRQTINRRTANHASLYVDYTDTNVIAAPVNNGSFILPSGTTGQAPTPIAGMMRWNNTTGEMEVYQTNTWKALRYKESTGITQQNLGAGDGVDIYFGPLVPGPPAVVQQGTGSSSGQYSTNVAWGGQNLIVVVENVMQISGINYSVVQNPTIPTETYTAYLSQAAGTGSPVLYFNTSLNISAATYAATTPIAGTLTITSTAGTFTNSTSTPMQVGQQVVITGTNGGTGTINGSANGTGTYYIIATNGTTTFTLSLTAGGTAIATTTGTPTGLTLQLSGYAGITMLNTTSTGTSFSIGSTISVTGVTSTAQTVSAFNGTFTVTNSTATTVYYVLTTNPGTYQNSGAVTAFTGTPALFPALLLTGATVTGTNINSTVLSSTIDPNTDALTSITLNANPTGTAPINTAVTITVATKVVSNNSWYLKFSSPVPYGKVVIVLNGFDQ